MSAPRRAQGRKPRRRGTSGSAPRAVPCRIIEHVATMRIRDAGRWLARHNALVLLAVTTSALAAGGMLQLAAAGGTGDAAWIAAGLCGAGYALGRWRTRSAGASGVDVIALLAVVGALAVGELLAAAVISVMLASGRALEAWAAGRARRDLRTLLERAPRTARRYTGRALAEVPLDAVMPGDLLLVAPGELVPVDGTVTSAVGGAG